MLTHSSSLCHLRLGKTPTFHVRTIFHFLSSNIRLLSLSLRRILSCSMTTSRRILKRALSGIFWRRRRRRSDVLRKDIFAVVDYLWIHIFFREISFSALCSGVWNLLTKEMKSISISSRISRFNDENSRSRLELRDSMMKNLDLVSKHEIQWWKISISKISISNHMIGR